jgi:hypothetical protein
LIEGKDRVLAIVLFVAAVGIAVGIWLVVARAHKPKKYFSRPVASPLSAESGEERKPADNEAGPGLNGGVENPNSPVSPPESPLTATAQTIREVAEASRLETPAHEPSRNDLRKSSFDFEQVAISSKTPDDGSSPLNLSITKEESKEIGPKDSGHQSNSGQLAPETVSSARDDDSSDAPVRTIAEAPSITPNANATTEPVAEVIKKSNEKQRLKYKVPRVGPKGRPKAKAEPRDLGSTEPRDQQLEVCVQAIVDGYGFCELRLFGERLNESESELEGRGERESFALTAFGDNWYEIHAGGKLAALLSDGFEFSARGPAGEQIRWRLSGRDIYVLCGRHGFANPVSTTWLRTGRPDQLVLCKGARVPEVRAILEQAGCALLDPQGEDFGAPPGWVFFRRVRPARSLPHVPGDDILNILRPLPDVEIELDGGLRLQDSVYLAGYPPKINISGDIPSHAPVTIDGHQAERQPDGSFTASGWDEEREHVVWCGGKQLSYSVHAPVPEWERWEPHSYAYGTVCGATAISKAGKLITSADEQSSSNRRTTRRSIPLYGAGL